MSSEITHSMNQLIDHLVDQVPGVLGALVSSADGFTLVARLPADATLDAAALGAMSAAALALANRLVQSVGAGPATVSHHRSADAQTFVFA
ncbi:MAG: roadblock/LC7 domain-containing protein, partial [Ilumatobacter sp.]